MQYMLLIYGNEAEEAAMPQAEMGALLADFDTFTNELAEAGGLVGGERLRPTTDATTVRVRNGETLLTDGPFAETKEHFGGYYIVEAKDLDAALAWAAKVPSARYGSVEVRPIWPHEGEGQ